MGNRRARRTPLVIHVLSVRLAHDFGLYRILALVGTHSEPTPKIHINPIFCARGICSLTTIGTGRTSNKISVAIFNTAVAIYRGVLSMQLPSVIVTSQFRRKGVQAKISGKTRAMLYPTTRNMLA